MKIRLFPCALILLAVAICFPISVSSQVTAIKAGKLVNPETGSTSVNQIILVEGQKITAVGSGIKIPDGAAIVDLSNSTVLPGLFDAHTHLCIRVRILADRLGIEYFDQFLLDPPGYRAIQGVAYAQQMLASGFTTVRDVGNSGKYVDVDLRRGIEEGLVSGPTMIVAGRIIAPFGGQFRTRADKEQLLANPEYLFADSHEEIQKAIRENVYFGATVIKIVVDGKKWAYSTDDIKFIVAEANRAGVKVAAHCQTQSGARSAIEAGVASIEHGWFLDDADLELMKKNNVILVGTDFTEKALSGFGWDEAGAKRIHARRVERLKRVYSAGITMAFGTDVMVDVKGETRGSLAVGYIDSFVEAGIPAKVILQTMIPNAARLLGVEKERGSIAVGMAADLLGTPENPLDNIQTLKKVSFVMKNGRVFKSGL